MGDKPKPLISRTKAAEFLGVTIARIDRLVAEGHLESAGGLITRRSVARVESFADDLPASPEEQEAEWTAMGGPMASYAMERSAARAMAAERRAMADAGLDWPEPPDRPASTPAARALDVDPLQEYLSRHGLDGR